MNFEKIIEFLRSEEERIAGQVVEIPVDPIALNWGEEIVDSTLIEFSMHLDAFLENGTAGKFSERLELIRTGPVDHKGNLSEEEVQEKVEIFQDIFREMLHDDYGLPVDNYVALQWQLMAYQFYLWATKMAGFYFPAVDKRLSSIGMGLIQVCSLFIGAISKRGERRDNATPGGDAMKDLSEQRDEAIKGVLEKLQIGSLQEFKSNRKLRKEFYDECRTKTAAIDPSGFALADITIERKARDLLKNNVVKATV